MRGDICALSSSDDVLALWLYVAEAVRLFALGSPDLASCTTNRYSHGRAQEITQEQDDRKSTTEPTLSAPVRFFFFRPTPSWLLAGRYTRSTAAKR